MFPNRKLQRYLALLLVLCCNETKANDAENQTSVSTSFVEPKKDSRGLFSPRMDYDQWTPLGRGDPLKNDPTYDYVPPVLEHVHYWIDPASRKPDPPLPSDVQKTEILVLGVSSKKPSSSAATASHIESRRDTYDPYIKFVDSSSKYNYHGVYSRPQKHQYSGTYYSAPYYSSKIKFENSHTSQVKEDTQRTPYTVLMPPPLNQPKYEINPELSEIIHNVTSSVDYYKSPATESSVSIDEANLIYHSSTTTTAEEWASGNTQYATVAEPSSLVTWRTPTPTPAHFDYTSPSIGSQIGHTPSSSSSSTFKFPLAPVDGIQTLSPSDSNPTVTYVGVGDTPMHKGTVTDDKPDLNNSYVNIGKPNLRPSSPVEHVTAMPPNKHHTHKPVKTIISSRPNYVLNPNQFDYMTSTYHKPASASIRIHHHHLESPIKIQPPMTLQTMQTMQTMQPPPMTEMKTSHYQSSTPLLYTLLQKEQEKVTPQYIPTSTTPRPTTPTTTTLSALTTDPLFSHYKQPAAPLRGPMYLIIQGHSKVKTYGPSKTNTNKEAVQEANEISYSDDFKVKHIHSNHLKAIERPVRMELRGHKNLQTLQHVLDTGLGSVDFKKLGKPRQKRNYQVQEALLGAQYKVSEGVQTTETYRKGIVESSDIFDVPRKKYQRSKRQLGFDEYLPIEEAEDAISEFFDSVYEGSGL